jgi:hypothetical protein
MKTLVALIAGALVTLVGWASPQVVDLRGGYCCDAADISRCQITPMEPLDNPCRCLGLNDGHVCL